jgi:hypothetical protein
VRCHNSLGVGYGSNAIESVCGLLNSSPRLPPLKWSALWTSRSRLEASKLCNVTDQLHGWHLNGRDQLELEISSQLCDLQCRMGVRVRSRQKWERCYGSCPTMGTAAFYLAANRGVLQYIAQEVVAFTNPF